MKSTKFETMKQTFATAILLVATAINSLASFDYSWTVATDIPDANPSGFVNSQTIGMTTQGNNLPTAPYITSVLGVTLNLSGGWNGDLYAYLRYEVEGVGTGFTTLLNRVGGTPASSVYTTSGMSVFLTAGMGDPDIHTATSPTGGDSFNVDSTGSSTTFSSFIGLDPTAGTWSVYFADLSGNHVSTLDSWGLNLEVVPEPVNMALGIVGGIAGIGGLVRWRLNRKPVQA